MALPKVGGSGSDGVVAPVTQKARKEKRLRAKEYQEAVRRYKQSEDFYDAKEKAVKLFTKSKKYHQDVKQKALEICNQKEKKKILKKLRTALRQYAERLPIHQPFFYNVRGAENKVYRMEIRDRERFQASSSSSQMTKEVKDSTFCLITFFLSILKPVE